MERNGGWDDGKDTGGYRCQRIDNSIQDTAVLRADPIRGIFSCDSDSLTSVILTAFWRGENVIEVN